MKQLLIAVIPPVIVISILMAIFTGQWKDWMIGTSIAILIYVFLMLWTDFIWNYFNKNKDKS